MINHSLSLEVIIILEVLVSDISLLLEDDRSDESHDKDTDEDPEDSVELKSAVFVHQFLLGGVVSGEEESPGAHEHVGANKGSADKHDSFASITSGKAPDSSHSN